MAIDGNAMLLENAKIVMGVPPAASPATTEDYVSMKGYDRCCVIISIDTGTSPGAHTVTLKQASAVAGTGEKALAFTEYWKNADTGATDTLVKTTAVSTFATGTTTDKNEMYVLEILASDLDMANDFDCVRVDMVSGTTSVSSAVYILYPAKFGKATPPTAITD